MSVWLDHVKATRKKCPGMSFKEVLIEAKKTYNKSTQKAGPIVCKSSKRRKTKKSTKTKRRKRRKTAKGRKRRTAKSKKHKVPKKFKCKNYPNAPEC